MPDSTESTSTARSAYPFRASSGYNGLEGRTRWKPMSDERQAAVDAWLALSKEERGRRG